MQQQQQQTDDKDNKKVTIASRMYKLVMRDTPLWPTAVRVCQTVPFVGYLLPAVGLGLVSIAEGLVQIAEGWNNSPVLSNLSTVSFTR
ncbi:hypothetical protein WJX82_009091 [Trebouxia sp. C0006]